MKIAPDGEILVRGENVTSGYFNAAGRNRARLRGRLVPHGRHRRDRAGRPGLHPRPQEGNDRDARGLNVFPEDVERVLNHVPGVRDSAVVGVSTGGEERVHAVLVVDPGVDPDDVARRANAELEDHQKIRRALVWPEPELPRTEGTRKLKRAAIRRVGAHRSGAAAVRRGRRCARGARREICGPRRSLRGDDPGGARVELARTRGADGRARGHVPDADRRRRVRRRARHRTTARARRARDGERGAAGRAGGLPRVDPLVAGARDSPRQPADLDSADRARVRLAARRGPRAPARPRRTGDLRRQPSELHGRTR